VGTPQVTAKITKLEDLEEIPGGFFSTSSNAGDFQSLQTVLLDEISLRKNLLPMDPSRGRRFRTVFSKEM
jgi:hypothetical protein